MLDLPDYGYVSRRIVPIDPGGVADGSLGGPSDYIDRPGYRYSVQFELPQLPMREARQFETLLEQASRDDASYPWPLDFKPAVTGSSTISGSPWPAVNGANPVGATLAIKNLLPGYPFRQGQPISLVQGAFGYVHRVVDAVVADGTGHATVSLFPLTRVGFVDNDRVEVENPRIRGILSWEGSSQGAYGRRGFTFTITERR